MGIRYRKRIKIAPGININISKSGVSTTIGRRGASVNIGSRGTFLNTGIPGTGLYSRERIGGGNESSTSNDASLGCFSICLSLIFAFIGVLLICLSNNVVGWSIGGLLLFCAILFLIAKSLNENKEVKATTENSDSVVIESPQKDSEEDTKFKEVANILSTIDHAHFDPLFIDAVASVIGYPTYSTAMIQRKYEIGCSRAGKILEQMEELGIVGPMDKTKRRRVLVASIYDITQAIANSQAKDK